MQQTVQVTRQTHFSRTSTRPRRLPETSRRSEIRKQSNGGHALEQDVMSWNSNSEPATFLTLNRYSRTQASESSLSGVRAQQSRAADTISTKAQEPGLSDKDITSFLQRHHGKSWSALSPQDRAKLIVVLEKTQMRFPEGAAGGMLGSLGRSLGRNVSNRNSPEALNTPELPKIMGTSRQVAQPCQSVDPVKAKLCLPLLEALDKGLLARTGPQGSVIHHLAEFMEKPVPEGIDKHRVVRELTGALCDYKSFNQDKQGTCGVTTIGREHIRKDPADFVRVSTGLISQGTSLTKTGLRLELPNDTDLTKPFDRSHRNLVERAYQDSLMEVANGDQCYQPENDTHYEGTNSCGSGTYLKASLYLRRHLLGYAPEREIQVPPSNGGRPYLQRNFSTALESYSQQDKRMQASLEWGDGRHAVNIISEDRDFIYLDNPWGYGDVGQSNGSPCREVVEAGGIVKMTRQDFFENLRAYSSF